MGTVVLEAPAPLIPPTMSSPEPYGPWADLEYARVNGEAPFVLRCAETGQIYDRILGMTFVSSEDYARVQGHQQYIPEPPAKKADMKVWAGLRKAGDHWRAPKVTQAMVNFAHKSFWAGTLDLGDYSDLLVSFLKQFHAEDEVFDYLNAQRPDDREFCTAPLFAPLLKQRCREFISDASVLPKQDTVLDAGTEAATSLSLEGYEARKQAANKETVTRAYSEFKDAVPEVKGVAAENLYTTILRFAKQKLTAHLYNKDEGSATADDHAQTVTVYVWQHLHEFKGGSDSFHSWLDRICFTTGSAAQSSANKQQRSRVELLVPSEDGSLEDNPELYPASQPPVYLRELPDSIVGVDLKICWYIREGMTYRKIAETLGMTEAAIKQRVAAMRAKNVPSTEARD